MRFSAETEMPYISVPSIMPSFLHPLSPWDFERILGQRRTIYQRVMELLHLWVSLFDHWHLRLPLQQLQPETLRNLGTVAHLHHAFRIIIVEQSKLFVEALFFKFCVFCFSVQKKKIK